MAPHRAHNPGVLVRVQVPQPNMSDLKFESQENSNSLLHRVSSVFEDPDPQIVEEFKDREQWVQKQAGGKVHIIPPQRDKHSMLALDTQDSELYSLFNSAASQVTKNLGGFHQVGFAEHSGLSAWEMWVKPDVSDGELLAEVKRVMIEIAIEDVGS